MKVRPPVPANCFRGMNLLWTFALLSLGWVGPGAPRLLAQAGKPELLISDSAGQFAVPRQLSWAYLNTNNSGGSLALRPNTDQLVYLYVKNPAKRERHFKVQLMAGKASLAEAEVTVPPRGQRQVVFKKPAPPPPPPDKAASPAPPAEPELRLPVQIQARLLDDAGKALVEKTIPVDITRPREYVAATANYDKQTKRLTLQIKSQFSGPDADLQLTLFRDDPNPHEIQLEQGLLRGKLSEGESKELYAIDPFANISGPSTVRICLAVDHCERAFCFKAVNIEGKSGNVQLEPDREHPYHVDAPRYSRPVDKYPVHLAFDGSQAGGDVSLQVAIGEAGAGGAFRPAARPLVLRGPRDQRLQAKVGEGDGGILLHTTIKDWDVALDTTGMYGWRTLRVRALDSQEREVLQPDTRAVVFEDARPQPQFVDPPQLATRGQELEVKARPRSLSGTLSGIKEAYFFFGEPEADDKVPKDKVPAIAGQDATWTAKLPIAADQKSPVVIGVQFINYVGAAGVNSTRVEIRDPPAQGTKEKDKPKGATIKGTVVEGERPQPDHEVRLLDAKGASLKKTKTNDKGEFEFKDVPPGSYKVASRDADANTKGEAEVTVEMDGDKFAVSPKVVEIELKR